MTELEKEIKASKARIAEIERILEKMAAESDARLAKEAKERRKAEAQRKKDAAERKKAEAERKKAEAARKKAEAARKKAEAKYEAEREKAEAKAEEERRKADEKRKADWEDLRASIKATQATVRETNKQLGDYSKTDSEMLEQEYADAIKRDRRIGDIPIDRVYPNYGEECEFDLVCPNGEFVFVLENKRRFTLRDVRKFAHDRLARFAKIAPEMARDRKVIGAIGGGSIPSRVVKEAESLGLLVLGWRDRKLIVKSDKGMRAV